MNIQPIEEKAYAMMKLRFKAFVGQIEALCCDQNDDKVWLEGEDVRLLLSVGKRTLQYYRDSGKLPFSRIGNKCYYKASDVQKLIADAQIG